jgi:large subunit ribosomal protein L9
MSRMKVVLKEPVEKLGNAGDLVTVAGGYARNFLIPRGLAVAATKGALKHAEHWARSQGAREAKERKGAEELKARLEAQPLRLTARAGPDGRLFGSVTANDVSQAIASSSGVQIDRHTIELEPIRSLGVHTARISLPFDVDAEVTVEVAEATS